MYKSREAEDPGLLDADVEPGHGDGGPAEAPGGHEALMTADDRPVLAASQNRLNEAELAQAPRQRLELVVGDPTGVGGVGLELIDRDLLDGECPASHGRTPATTCFVAPAE
jgi:hypothetical protein